MSPQPQWGNKMNPPNHDRDVQAPEHDFLKHAVEKGIDDAFIEKAERFGRSISGRDGVSKSQIRDVYSAVKLLEMQVAGKELTNDLLEELRMVGPRLTYAAQRHGGKVRDLEKVIKPALAAVTGPSLNSDERRKRFRRFCLGFEAILAYRTE